MPTDDPPRPLDAAAIEELRRAIERVDAAVIERDQYAKSGDPGRGAMVRIRRSQDSYRALCFRHRHALIAAAEAVSRGVDGIVTTVDAWDPGALLGVEIEAISRERAEALHGSRLFIFPYPHPDAESR
jgi:hypothetical protein